MHTNEKKSLIAMIYIYIYIIILKKLAIVNNYNLFYDSNDS